MVSLQLGQPQVFSIGSFTRMFCSPLPQEDFAVSSPLRVHSQKEYDECTSCALASIAEDILHKPVDPSFIYKNSKDNKFGISPQAAMQAVIDHGVLCEDGTIEFPFHDYRRVWGLSLRKSMIRTMYNKNKSLFVGLYWQPYWGEGSNIAYHGDKIETFLPHAVKSFGQQKKDDIMYIKVLNSMGEQSGDKGVWLIPDTIKFNFAYELL